MDFKNNAPLSPQLINCYSDWSSAINDGSSVDVIYLDYAKSFDSVVQSKLFLKLEAHGITGNLLSWIKMFLSDRYHYVCINNTNSNILPVLSGVPQGTVLGPTFFIILVNDMPSVITKRVKLSSFADDSKIYEVIVSIIDCICLQMVLSQVSFWSDLWQLTSNCEQSLVLHLGNANPRYIYTIEGRPLSALDCVRDLGVTM